MIRKMIRAVLILVVLLYANSAAECPVFEKAINKYQSNMYYTMEFMQLIHSDIFKSVDTLSGSIDVCSDGRFHLTMPNQVLVSNGTILWNYAIDNEQVIIDSISRNDIWNPVMLFFNPREYYKCISEACDGSKTEFSLIAYDSLISPGEFQLTVKSEDFIPSRITYFDENDSRIEISINDFIFISNLSDSTFHFVPPTGIEIIKMP